MASCLVFLFVLSAALVGAEDSWPGFRRSADLAGVAEELAPPLKLVWTHETGSSIASTAAIVGDTVYVGTTDSRLLALDLAEGTAKWSFETTGPVSASPCVIDGTLFIGDEGGMFYAINAADGELRWKHETGAKITASATPAPNAVLVGSYNHVLYSFKPDTGELNWTFEADAQVHCTPCVAGDTVVIAGCDGFVRMIGLADGIEKASADVESNFAAGAAYADGHVYVGSIDGRFMSVRRSDGEVVWINEGPKRGPCHAGAAVSGDVLIFASRARVVFRAKPEDGTTVWTFRPKGLVDSSPVIAGQTVYVGSNDGNLYALNIDTGEEAWRFAAGAPITASAAIAGGRLVIGTDDGALYCFEPHK